MNFKKTMKQVREMRDAGDITGLQKIRNKAKQGGFTLLELLVVVAILAAIAGTATIALQDTDARASAAAHVAMMDELNKGVRTFRVLQRNQLPNNLDSLVAKDADKYELLPKGDDKILAIEDVVAGKLTAEMASVMKEIGMTHLRYINADASKSGTDDDGNPTGGGLPKDVDSCAAANLQAQVANRGNNMVAGNIFQGPEGNGCGESVAVAKDVEVAFWSGSVERVMGPGAYGDAKVKLTGKVVGLDSSDATIGATAPVLMAVGMGPSSNLFDASELGGMTSVPVYRHVAADQYNRFIGLFKIAEGTYAKDGESAAAWTVAAVDQVAFVGTVDGAGDTKEEELGEWDGSRNTI